MRWLRLSRSGGQNRPVSCLEIGYELPVFRWGGAGRGGRLIGGPLKGALCKTVGHNRLVSCLEIGYELPVPC